MMNSRSLKAILGLFLLTTLSKIARSDTNRETENLLGNDEVIACGIDEFFYVQQGRCRNCSDLTQLFLNHQGWLSNEVLTNILSSKNNITSGDRYHKLSRDESHPSSRRYQPQNGDILSRLVSSPSRGNADLVDSIIDDGEQDSDSIRDLYDLSDADSASIFTSNEDRNLEIIRSKRQTQKLVDAFIKSPIVGDELLNAIDQCRRYQNVTACQLWSNLCVMTMYSYSDLPSSADSAASLKISPLSHSYESAEAMNTNDKRLHPNRQWQKCKQFNIYSICDSLRAWHRTERRQSLDIQNIYALDEPLSKFGSSLSYKLNQTIQLLAYRYSYDGRLINIDQFGLNDMRKFCPTTAFSTLDGGEYIRLSGKLELKCSFDSLLAGSENFNDTTFIDIYLAYPLDGTTFFRPVPILIKNLIYYGQQVNQKYHDDPNRWKLVHRFFHHSSIDLGQNNEAGIYSRREVIIFAKTARLDLKFKLIDRGAFLSSILLTIDYGAFDRTSIRSNFANTSHPILTSDIAINQRLIDMQNQRKDLDLALTILSILGGVWSLIHCYNIQKCHGIVKLDLVLLFRFVLINCDTLSKVLTAVTFIHLGYIFTVLKLQSNVHILAPSQELEDAFLKNLQIAFILKLVSLIYKSYITLNADIFFIDWEKPKMMTSNQIFGNQAKLGIAGSQQPIDTENSKISNVSDHLRGVHQSSFWRPYTVINRWLQLQTLRRQDISIQLLVFVCFIEITKIQNIATSDINVDTSWAEASHVTSDWPPDMNPHISKAFRVLVLSSIYLIISLLQIAFRRLVHEPLFKNTINEFIDLCSVANVSVFCMLYPRFGYYIHGRNANGSGDCSVVEINSLLEREERNLCSKRGLTSNSDQQTFVLILPRIINDHYRKLLKTVDPSALNQSTASNNPLTNTNGNQFNRDKAGVTQNTFFKMALSLPLAQPSFSLNHSAISTMVAQNRAINAFLTNFLNHIYKDIDYKVRASKRFECFLFDADLESENSMVNDRPLSALQGKTAAATFCMDHKNSFTSMLWLGIETDLVLTELLSMVALDIWFEQHLVLTAALVWLIHHVFKILYEAFGRQNLITKALVDEKFLLKRC